MNTFSKLYLALLGVFPWKYLPAIPLEMVLLPRWAPFHIYKMSSWSRAMLIPLSLSIILNPHADFARRKATARAISPRHRAGRFALAASEKFWTWRNFFLRLDDTLKFLQPLRIGLLRQRALEAAERWMLERIREGSDGLAAVYPAMLNCMIALRSLGYSKTNPVYAKVEKDFAGLFVDDPDDFRIQPCLSPVWDTAITIISLADSGLSPEHPALQKAAEWLVNKEVRIRGDWAVNNSYPEASGWAFEYNNVYYADTDDTAMVLMALRLVQPEDSQSLTICFVARLGGSSVSNVATADGRLRQERDDSVVGRYAFCGSQRDSRSHLQRFDCAHARVARLHRFRSQCEMRSRRDRIFSCHSG
jgi:Squalene cyclase